MNNLEQDKGSEEQVIEPTSDEKQEVEPTSKEPVEPTSETTPEFFSEEQKTRVAELISVAEASVQSAKDKEATETRRQHLTEIRAIKADAEKAHMEGLEKTEQERFADTEPDLLKELQELRRRVHVTATETAEVQAAGYAYLIGKREGVDPEVLVDSASKEEMEAKVKDLVQATKAEAEKAKDTRIKQLEEELAKAKKSPQKVDSSTTTVPGVDYSKMSSEDLIKRGLQKLNK